MASATEHAERLIAGWKGDDYVFGHDVLDETGLMTREYGRKALIVSSGIGKAWSTSLLDAVTGSLDLHGVGYEIIGGARPNSPREDLYRITAEIAKIRPDVVLAVGGGSTIDAVKAAAALAVYSSGQVCECLNAMPGDASGIEPFFGTGRVSALVDAAGVYPVPVVAVQTVASSAAHLTKYSNITDPASGQKKLLIDMAIVPPKAVFDYGVTAHVPRDLTLDGGFDGISHLWEVFMGATGKDYYDTVEDIVTTGISLIVENLPKAAEDPSDLDARAALGLATDLGGYAIMVGGTNGGHLGSFSLVDVLSHGRACAVLNPYYSVLFAEAIGDQLRSVGAIYRDAGYIDSDTDSLDGRELAEAVAGGMIAFSSRLGFPVTLSEAGAEARHVERMIEAAKNPQLASKLANMPTPMEPSRGDVDTYMRPVLDAAFDGDMAHIVSMPSE